MLHMDCGHKWQSWLTLQRYVILHSEWENGLHVSVWNLCGNVYILILLHIYSKLAPHRVLARMWELQLWWQLALFRGTNSIPCYHPSVPNNTLRAIKSLTSTSKHAFECFVSWYQSKADGTGLPPTMSLWKVSPQALSGGITGTEQHVQEG